MSSNPSDELESERFVHRGGSAPVVQETASRPSCASDDSHRVVCGADDDTLSEKKVSKLARSTARGGVPRRGDRAGDPGRTDVARRIARRVVSIVRARVATMRRARAPAPVLAAALALALSFVRTEAQEVRDPLSSLSAAPRAQGASASFDSSVDCAARIAWTPEDVAVDEVLVPCGLAVAGDAVPTEARDESCAACLVGVGGVLLPRMRTAGLDPNDPAHVTSCVTAALPSAARAGVRVGELLFACERVAAAALQGAFPQSPQPIVDVDEVSPARRVYATEDPRHDRGEAFRAENGEEDAHHRSVPYDSMATADREPPRPRPRAPGLPWTGLTGAGSERSPRDAPGPEGSAIPGAGDRGRSNDDAARGVGTPFLGTLGIGTRDGTPGADARSRGRGTKSMSAEPSPPSPSSRRRPPQPSRGRRTRRTPTDANARSRSTSACRARKTRTVVFGSDSRRFVFASQPGA